MEEKIDLIDNKYQNEEDDFENRHLEEKRARRKKRNKDILGTEIIQHKYSSARHPEVRLGERISDHFKSSRPTYIPVKASSTVSRAPTTDENELPELIEAEGYRRVHRTSASRDCEYRPSRRTLPKKKKSSNKERKEKSQSTKAKFGPLSSSTE